MNSRASATAVVLCACTALTGPVALGARIPPSFEFRVPKAPAVFNGDSGRALVYELHITNLTASPFVLRRVEVRNAADGAVVHVVEDSAALRRDITRPGASVPAAERAKIAGNHIVLDIGGGHFAFYAHLQPGSLRVRVGDRVKRGQLLGLVGNSGNSTEPHLHFHVGDALAAGTATLGAEGVPWQLETLEVVGRCAVVAAIVCTRSTPLRVRQAMPMQNQLVRFPGPVR